MAAQDVAEISPRVRRAVEGPVPLTSGALQDAAILAMAADAIADVILLTNGQWEHKLVVSHRNEDTNAPDGWQVDPPLEPEEESMIAAQAAINYFVFIFQNKKVSERIQNEGQEWEYGLSANLLRDTLAALKEQRDAALTSLKAANPIMARYASLLEVRDRIASAVLEPWVSGGLGGGIELVP